MIILRVNTGILAKYRIEIIAWLDEHAPEWHLGYQYVGTARREECGEFPRQEYEFQTSRYRNGDKWASPERARIEGNSISREIYFPDADIAAMFKLKFL